MAQRRFGPTLGAGVAVIELEADKILEAAPLGVTGYVGVLTRGSTAKLIQTFSKKQFLKRCGGTSLDGQTNDAGLDFWAHSNGAGELHLIRVTDGTEVKAKRTFYDSSTTVKNRVMTVEAANGGRWGGRTHALVGVWTTTGSDLTETTLAVTGQTMLLNQWKGAKLSLDGVSGKTYEVLSNTTAGILTVKSDSKMKTDYTASLSTDKGFSLELLDDGNGVQVMLDAGDVDTDNLFSMSVFVDGDFIKRYPNLSMDPASAYYFVRLINDDDGNDEIFVTDLNTPASTGLDKRPANASGVNSAVTALTLTAIPFQMSVTVSPTGANPTCTLGATTDIMKYRDRLEITMTSATVFTVKSLDLGAAVAIMTPTGTVGTPYTPETPLLPPFTIVQGSTVLASGDKLLLEWLPFEPNALVGGTLYPDYTNEPLKKFRVAANDHKSITIAVGDLTAVASVSDKFKVAFPMKLRAGYDGVDGVADANFTAKLDPATSKFKTLVGQNKGLVKLACPGKTSTAVQKAGLAFAEAMNWQFRVEIPDTTVTEDGAISFINATIGRSDFGVTALPSYGSVDNPLKPGQLKLQTLTGMIHGREALVAKNFDGYHKAAAGLDVTLPKVLTLPTENLNEETLNPQGVNVIKFLKGNCVIWGDRTISLDPAWKFKHQRELMSHYENRLREGFDFIVFALNNKDTQALLLTSLRAFFLPEFQKGAVFSDKGFDEAVSIKLDDTINTNATRGAGDLFAEIKLRLAETVERFIMRIGKAGIFEQLG